MRTESISDDVCRRLIYKGYHYFITKHKIERDDVNYYNDVITLEAVREAEHEHLEVVAIEQLMNLPENPEIKFLVTYRD